MQLGLKLAEALISVKVTHRRGNTDEYGCFHSLRIGSTRSHPTVQKLSKRLDKNLKITRAKHCHDAAQVYTRKVWSAWGFCFRETLIDRSFRVPAVRGRQAIGTCPRFGSDNNNKRGPGMLRHARAWPAGLSLLLLSSAASADWTVNMRKGVTDISHSVFDLHMTIFWICVAIGVLVFGVMLWSMVMHRKSRGAVPATFHENLSVEIAWTVIPLVILVGMAIPATKTLIEIYDAEEAEIDIMITGYQWRWQYRYMGEDVSFFSNMATPREAIANSADKGENYLLEVDEPMVIPVDTKVRFLITAADVIHSWWVPDLAVKKDAIPGFINEAATRVEEVGTYRGQCTELCGREHAFMPVVVEVVSKEDYATWLAEKKELAAREAELREKDWTLEELAERGERIYSSACASCHQPSGEGIPPMFPALKGSDIATTNIPAHIDIVVNGKPGTAMAAYGTQLSEVDIAAVITYERNAWGNDTGEMVTPLQILEFKEGQ